VLTGIRRRKVAWVAVLLLLVVAVLAVLWMQSRRADAEKLLQARFKAGEFDGRPCPDAPTVTDIDGNTYTTVQIGCQCWMRENLRATRRRRHRRTGELLPPERLLLDLHGVQSLSGFLTAMSITTCPYSASSMTVASAPGGVSGV